MFLTLRMHVAAKKRGGLGEYHWKEAQLTLFH